MNNAFLYFGRHIFVYTRILDSTNNCFVDTDIWCGQNDEYVFQSLSTVGTYSNGEKSRSGFILLYYTFNGELCRQFRYIEM